MSVTIYPPAKPKVDQSKSDPAKPFKFAVSKDAFIGSPLMARISVPKMVNDGVGILNYTQQDKAAQGEFSKLTDMVNNQEYVDIVASAKPLKDITLEMSVVGSNQLPAETKTASGNPVSITDGADYPILDMEVKGAATITKIDITSGEQKQTAILSTPVTLAKGESLKILNGVWGKQTASEFTALPEADQKAIRDLHLYNGTNNILTGAETTVKYLPESEVKHRGKNLFDVGNITDNQTITNNGNGTLSINLNGSTVATTTQKLKDLAPNTSIGKKYVFSMKNTGNRRDIFLFGENKKIDYNRPFTMTEKALNGAIGFYITGAIRETGVISEIQLEEGTVATPYKLYLGDNHTAIIQSPAMQTVALDNTEMLLNMQYENDVNNITGGKM